MIKNPNNKKSRKINNLRPIILVTLCTIFTSAGQILFKVASKNLNSVDQIIINIPLWIGFICYGLGSLLMILALKYGDLSLVYPFIALSFVWVNVLSIIFFQEHVKILNWLGITAIIVGVSLIGYGSSKLKKNHASENL